MCTMYLFNISLKKKVCFNLSIIFPSVSEESFYSVLETLRLCICSTWDIFVHCPLTSSFDRVIVMFVSYQEWTRKTVLEIKVSARNGYAGVGNSFSDAEGCHLSFRSLKVLLVNLPLANVACL